MPAVPKRTAEYQPSIDKLPEHGRTWLTAASAQPLPRNPCLCAQVATDSSESACVRARRQGPPPPRAAAPVSEATHPREPRAPVDPDQRAGTTPHPKNAASCARNMASDPGGTCSAMTAASGEGGGVPQPAAKTPPPNRPRAGTRLGRRHDRGPKGLCPKDWRIRRAAWQGVSERDCRAQAHSESESPRRRASRCRSSAVAAASSPKSTATDGSPPTGRPASAGTTQNPPAPWQTRTKRHGTLRRRSGLALGLISGQPGVDAGSAWGQS